MPGPRDKTWVADGVASDVWSPVSPVSGKLDAFRWQAPAERLSAPVEPIPRDADPAPPPALDPEPIAPPALPAATPLEPFIEVAAQAQPPQPEPTEPLVATQTAQNDPPASAAQEDALTRLAAIRRSAKMEAPRRAEILPLIVAPDDPGPDAPRI